jgi:phosphoglycerate dehydrogenase-like enzyme
LYIGSHPLLWETSDLRKAVILLTRISAFSACVQVESHAKALPEEELIAKIATVHAIGVRSKTTLSKRVLEAGSRLLCTGNFCIGTDRVDLEAARRMGIPAFNAPFSNTRLNLASTLTPNVLWLLFLFVFFHHL